MTRIYLKDKCEAEMKQLERFHYEALTKEHVLGLAIANSTVSNNAVINSYYEDYYESFVNYEKAKKEFFNKYIAEYAKNYSKETMWEIDFFAGDLIFHD